MKKPKHLYKEAGVIFDKLYRLVHPIMKPGDEELLAVLANSYFDYERACESLKDRGPVIAGDTMVRKNPAFDVVKETYKMIESLSAHFGLSPKSRGDSLFIPEKKKDAIDNLLN